MDDSALGQLGHQGEPGLKGCRAYAWHCHTTPPHHTPPHHSTPHHTWVLLQVVLLSRCYHLHACMHVCMYAWPHDHSTPGPRTPIAAHPLHTTWAHSSTGLRVISIGRSSFASSHHFRACIRSLRPDDEDDHEDDDEDDDDDDDEDDDDYHHHDHEAIITLATLSSPSRNPISCQMMMMIMTIMIMIMMMTMTMASADRHIINECAMMI